MAEPIDANENNDYITKPRKKPNISDAVRQASRERMYKLHETMKQRKMETSSKLVENDGLIMDKNGAVKKRQPKYIITEEHRKKLEENRNKIQEKKKKQKENLNQILEEYKKVQNETFSKRESELKAREDKLVDILLNQKILEQPKPVKASEAVKPESVKADPVKQPVKPEPIKQPPVNKPLYFGLFGD